MRTKLHFGAVLLAAAFLAAACQEKPMTQAQLGKAYFRSLGCVSCHQIGNAGGTYGPNLSYVGFRKSPQWINRWLKNPSAWRPQTLMPNFHLSKPMRAALTAYLSTLKGQAWPKGKKPWDAPALAKSPVARGKMIFNKVGCVTCHGEGGQGGYPNNNVIGGQIPALTKVAEDFSKQELVEKITYGVIPTPKDPSQPPPMLHMPPWGQVLSHQEISDVAAYLMSLDPNAGANSGGF